MRLMTRQDLLAVLLRRYTRARVVVGYGRSAAIKTFQRVIDLPYVVAHLLMRADVPQQDFGAGAYSALLHFRPQYAHGSAVLVEIRLIYWRLAPFERLLENMTPLSR